MRIGELAALVGVSTRTVRHYHHQGLLPEPERLPNGYREYRLRDAALLARVRRLAELGLSLDEIRDVLADCPSARRAVGQAGGSGGSSPQDETPCPGRDLREVLAELDDDLARRQQAIADRRERLAALLARDDLDADSAVSPELAAVLRELPAKGSIAEHDRHLLTLLDTGADSAERDRFLDLFRPLTEPDAVERAQDLYRRLDELIDAAPDDPRVEELAADLADHLPAGMADLMTGDLDPRQEEWMHTILGELPPAQQAAFRRMIAILRGRR